MMKNFKILAIALLLLTSFNVLAQNAGTVLKSEATVAGKTDKNSPDYDPNIVPEELRGVTAPIPSATMKETGSEGITDNDGSVMINKNKDQVYMKNIDMQENDPQSTDPDSPDYNPMINPDKFNPKKSER